MKAIKALQLILTLDEQPECSTDVVKLAPKTREQIEAALAELQGSSDEFWKMLEEDEPQSVTKNWDRNQHRLRG